MDKEKRRKLNLILYSIALAVSLFALYTFIVNVKSKCTISAD